MVVSEQPSEPNEPSESGDPNEPNDPAGRATGPRTRPYGPEVAEFVERFAAELTEAGMQRMASRVFACLLTEDSGTLGSAELSERLRISPAAVSGAIRYLSQVHLVTREREPGSRRERYRVHADAWYEAMTDRDALLGRWSATFDQGLKAVGPDTPAGRRIAETAEFFDFIRRELAMMLDRWHAHREAAHGGDPGPS